MNNMLNLNQLQYLDALLKRISHYSESKKDLKIVIKVGNDLLTGDFILFNPNKCPQAKSCDFDTVSLDNIQRIPDIAFNRLLAPFRMANTGVGPDTCKTAVNNLDLLFSIIFKDGMLIRLVNGNPWDGIHSLSPYLYNPIFIGNTIGTQLPFYALDSEKEYEVISIISSDE